MFSTNLEMAAVVREMEREREVARYERLYTLGFFDDETLRGKGVRAWVAARLLALALRLDRHAGERVAEQIRLRTA